MNTWLPEPLAPHHALLLLGLLAQSEHKLIGSVSMLGWCPRPATQDCSQFLASCLDILVRIHRPLSDHNLLCHASLLLISSLP